MPFAPDNPAPKVSVGILTRNAGRFFHGVMAGLSGQETPWPFEIVILDSASKDGTDTHAASMGARVIPYRPAKFLFGPARDKLFENCRGEVIVTISHDVQPADPKWLAKLTGPIFQGRADATIGVQARPPGGYAFYWDYHASWMRSVAIAFDQAYGQIAISCANMAIRRDVWEKLRFGNCATIEDRNIQVKLHAAGYRMVQVHDAWSYHGHRYTYKELDGRIGSFAEGWARLGFPYTTGRFLRDLMQPSRYLVTLEALLSRKLVSWLELVYPFAMCWMQYKGSRKASR